MRQCTSDDCDTNVNVTRRAGPKSTFEMQLWVWRVDDKRHHRFPGLPYQVAEVADAYWEELSDSDKKRKEGLRKENLDRAESEKRKEIHRK